MTTTVIQGTADVRRTLSEDELAKTMNFVSKVFSPTDPEMHEAVGARLGPDLIAPEGPIMLDDEIGRAFADDEDAKHVLEESKSLSIRLFPPPFLVWGQQDLSN
jgi:flavine halogenase